MSKQSSAPSEPRMGKGRSGKKRLPFWVSETQTILTEVYDTLRQKIKDDQVTPMELIVIAKDARAALIERESLIDSEGDE